MKMVTTQALDNRWPPCLLRSVPNCKLRSLTQLGPTPQFAVFLLNLPIWATIYSARPPRKLQHGFATSTKLYPLPPMTTSLAGLPHGQVGKETCCPLRFRLQLQTAAKTKPSGETASEITSRPLAFTAAPWGATSTSQLSLPSPSADFRNPTLRKTLLFMRRNNLATGGASFSPPKNNTTRELPKSR